VVTCPLRAVVMRIDDPMNTQTITTDLYSTAAGCVRDTGVRFVSVLG
jgi:hypothetical protein